jgi:hypothetical protein
VEKHTGFRFLPYGITKGNELIAILPLFFRRLHGIRVAASPPPLTSIPRMGVVITGSYDTLRQHRKEEYLDIIAGSLADELRSLAPDHFLMSLPAGFRDVRFFQWLGFEVTPWYTYVYDLTRPLEEIWAGFKGSKRTHVRQAEENGYTLKGNVAVSDLYRLMELRSRDMNQPLALPAAGYVEDLTRALPDRFRVVGVCTGDRVVGSVVVTMDRHMQMWLGGPKAVPGANDFLHWSLIREGKERGYATLEDVGANTRHLVRFKNQFNPSLALYYTVCRRNLKGRLAETLYHATRAFGYGRRSPGDEDAEWERFL